MAGAQGADRDVRPRGHPAPRRLGEEGRNTKTAADVPLYYNAVDIVERNLAERGGKVALYSPSRTLTFAEVSREANQVANALRSKLGLRIGEFVAILCPDLPEWPAAFFGTLKAGGAAVGINTLVTAKDLSYILRDCRARVLFVHGSLVPVFEAVDGPTFVEHVVVIGAESGRLSYADLIGDQPTEATAAPTHRDDICMLNYSSGTTGDPKGIPHAHKDLPLTAQLYAVDGIGLREDDRTFSVPKLFFTYGSGSNMIWPWYIGASIVLSDAPARQATSVLEQIDRFKPTVFNGVPTSYASMLAVADFTTRYDLSSLRMCVSAGESLPPAIWQGWKDRTGLEIVEGIGATETMGLYLTNRLGTARPGSVGTAVNGYEVRIVDDDWQEVAVGEAGQLIVRSETTVLSYLHQYERSRRTFRGEWMATGDRFRADADGYYWYVGRADDMLKVGGIWVSPLEIEATLTRHAAVLEAAVVGQPDGSQLIKPKAFIILRPGHAASDDLATELIAWCSTEMAPFKRPRWVEFVDELPRTATGKLQRSRLR